MGMFTTIIAEDNTEVQVKFGVEDFCDTYRVGEKLPQRPSSIPGRMLFADGVYDGLAYSEDDFQEYVVVVKDAVVVAVMGYEAASDAVTHHTNYNGASGDEIRATLGRQYGIAPVDKGLWTVQQWIDHNRKEAQRSMEAAKREFDWWSGLDAKDFSSYEDLAQAKFVRCFGYPVTCPALEEQRLKVIPVGDDDGSVP